MPGESGLTKKAALESLELVRAVTKSGQSINISKKDLLKEIDAAVKASGNIVRYETRTELAADTSQDDKTPGQVYNDTGYVYEFTSSDVDTGTDSIDEAAGEINPGDVLRFSSTGTLPGGLSVGVDYYVLTAVLGSFKVSTTPGGSAVNITSGGGGTHTVKRVNNGQYVWDDGNGYWLKVDSEVAASVDPQDYVFPVAGGGIGDYLNDKTASELDASDTEKLQTGKTVGDYFDVKTPELLQQAASNLGGQVFVLSEGDDYVRLSAVDGASNLQDVSTTAGGISIDVLRITT
ncbi:MAG: hypothetical protein CL666_14755 [Balneola sp.]|nr:hypothetical protein [Balneola sp.]|tara:strand:+ start:17115 stop:17987 length:873 start_codon:yes stop_codon:yes gene_type:complete